MNWSRFELGVADDCGAAVVFEKMKARPQAAGTCRYHLPFNVADETVSYLLEGGIWRQ